MKISVNELVSLSTTLIESSQKSYEQGLKDQSEKPLPNNLFDALLEYGKKTNTLMDWHKSSDSSDGCNWIQIQPTRDGSENISHVEISFDNNLMEIHHIGAKLITK